MLPRRRTALAISCAVLHLTVSPLAADELVLMSGASHTGIIVSETETLVQFQTRLGVIGVDREFIAELRRATPEENAALLTQWAAEAEEEVVARVQRRAERAAEEAAEQAFAEAQRAKGLVRYEDEWLTREEIQLRQNREAQRLAAANDVRIHQLQDELQREQVRAAGLDQERARLDEAVFDRDARIAQLELELREVEEKRRRVHRAYQYQIWSLQRQLEACRGQGPPGAQEAPQLP